MEENVPRVSVIVPNYNHERYLGERLESIFNQSYQNFEMILLDDASTDSSPQILRDHESHPRVFRLEINRQNSGSPFRQWKRGVELARGELIWIAESDDSAGTDFLETLVKRIDAGADLACCRPQKIDGEGKPFSESFWAESLDRERWTADFENEGFNEIRDYLCYRNTLPSASACLFRKRPDLFPEEVLQSRFTGDWLFWINYLRRGRFGYVAKPLSQHRSHDTTTRMNHEFEGEYDRLMERLRAIRTARSLSGKGAIRPSEVWKYRYLIRVIRRLKQHPEKNRPLFMQIPPELLLYTWLIEAREWWKA